ncbi:MAG: phage tail sheath C-terminal domain-containing protein [Pseudomonadota bacterium]
MAASSALASLWRSPTSTAEKDFVCSGVFVAPRRLLTAAHALAGAQPLFVRPAANATQAYPIQQVVAHTTLDAALVAIEQMPDGATALPLLASPGFDPAQGAYTLNGYFEGRRESPLGLTVLSFDPLARWYVTTPRHPKGHSGSAVCHGDKLWGLATAHYNDPTADRGCVIAIHQLWDGWLDAQGLPGDAGEEGVAALAIAGGVSTTTAAFVGETERGPTHPCLLTSWREFAELFGQPLPADRSFLGWAVRGFFENGGGRAHVVRVTSLDAARACIEIPTEDPAQQLVVEAREVGAFGNELVVSFEPGARIGMRLQITRCAETEDFDNLTISGPNPLMEKIESASRLVTARWLAPERAGALPLPAAWRLVGGDDGVPTVADLAGEHHPEAPAGPCGLAALRSADDVALVCLPDAVHPRFTAAEQAELGERLIAHAELTGAFAVLAMGDPAPASGLPTAPGSSSAAAAYLPWVGVESSPGGPLVRVPPVGHVAGAIARHDLECGIHSAPKGIVLKGVVPTPDDAYLDCAAGHRGIDALGRRGLNVLCRDAATGRVVIASAITLAIEAEWQAIRVRRVHSWIRQSIDRGTAWARFAPASEETWAEVRRQLTDFFTALWREGVLLGDTPEEAFLVRCDRTTMTQDDIDNHRLVCVTGFAPRDPDQARADLSPAGR